MSWKCLIKGHAWYKVGGPSNVGNGQFEQMLKCRRCNKTKYHRG